MNDTTEKTLKFIEAYKPTSIKEDVVYTGNLVEVDEEQAKAAIKGWIKKQPVSIGKGGRFETLRAFGALLRGCGYTEESIREKLKELNEKKFDPKKTDAELKTDVDKIAKWVMTLPKGLRERVVVGKKSDSTTGNITTVENTKTVGGIKAYTEDAPEDFTYLDAKVDEALNGDTMLPFTEAFKQVHVGHSQIMRGVIYSAVLLSSSTTKGIQPAVTGTRGSGKTHAIRGALHLVPRAMYLRDTLSPKALFYMTEAGLLVAKTIIYLDDAVVGEELNALFKRKQSEFQDYTPQTTVIDRKAERMLVPPRLVIIMTSVGAQGDDQLNDRQLVVDIKNEKADDEEFYKFESDRRAKGLPEWAETDEVFLCRAILTHIRAREFHVKLPQCDFSFYSDRRLQGQVYDLMEASAILNYKKREHSEENGIISVTANEDDLKNALDFDMFTFTDKEVETRLTKTLVAINQKLQAAIPPTQDSKDFSEAEIATLLKLTVPTTRSHLYGRGLTSHTVQPGKGLVGSASWVSVDTKKDNEVNKIQITVRRHTVNVGGVFAWIKLEDTKTTNTD